ncbi:mandelate racemase/muconate lactonizing enzyme family protein [Bacillus niameyensis]|uniref:mandelate racemase/muconate lactonizing enzyme family protein n=1 Tax=Bacillus niameyensis TaxID=1522308 RepID=UPI0018A84634|nr:enolase C-terminal domain-like protein [Bacillus niameyensis]
MKRTVMMVKLTDEDGFVGWGEGSPSYLWSSETIETVIATLENYFIPSIIDADIYDIDEFHSRMEKAIGPAFSTSHPIAKCALDTAIHDLKAHRLGVNISEMWGLCRNKEVTLSWTVSADNLQQAKLIVEEGLSQGYQNFNVKLGADPILDVQLCHYIKKMVPNGFLWGDANGGYTFNEATKYISSLEDAGLDLLEQPFSSNDWSNWKRFKNFASIPIAVDEAIVSPKDLMEWIKQDLITAFTTKVTRNGGLYPSFQCAIIAQQANLLILSSGLTETGLGLATNLHLACAFGIDLPCAWNGPQFLGDDILTKPLNIEAGRIQLPSGPGIGVEVDEEKVRFLSRDFWDNGR